MNWNQNAFISYRNSIAKEHTEKYKPNRCFCWGNVSDQMRYVCNKWMFLWRYWRYAGRIQRTRLDLEKLTILEQNKRRTKSIFSRNSYEPGCADNSEIFSGGALRILEGVQHPLAPGFVRAWSKRTKAMYLLFIWFHRLLKSLISHDSWYSKSKKKLIKKLERCQTKIVTLTSYSIHLKKWYSVFSWVVFQMIR